MKRNEANYLRSVIEQAAQSLPDNVAVTAVCLYPAWAENTKYKPGDKVQYDDKLWRCIQAHTAITGWEPSIATASLWETVNETHTGALDDPIPYDGNMALVSGLYYIQNGVIYQCIRDTVNPVYNALADLVGLYVVEV